MALLSQKMSQWIDRRIPKQATHTLTHGQVFIFPTRFGFTLLLTCTLLFILGTNYQNNPILLLCYLLISWFLLCLHACFLNLYGVQLSLDKVSPCHRLDRLSLSLLCATKNTKRDWMIYIDGEPLTQFSNISNNEPLTFSFLAKQRGHHDVPRLKLVSRYPFGLIQCWTYVRFDQKVWVYPAARQGDWQFGRQASSQLEAADSGLAAQAKLGQLDENFEGIKPFHPGESMSRVSWKHQAKNPDDALLLKDFSGEPMADNWLDLDHVYATDLEQKLSILTQACLTLERENRGYGLSLSGYGASSVVIPPSGGATHLTKCLEALARFGQIKVEQ